MVSSYKAQEDIFSKFAPLAKSSAWKLNNRDLHTLHIRAFADYCEHAQYQNNITVRLRNKKGHCRFPNDDTPLCVIINNVLGTIVGFFT